MCRECPRPDEWFSSALWPFSTLGWPDKTPELEYFYPTSTLVTGYDIIFFWVARMIFSACENMGSAPFKTVFMHGIVRDENGIKMSKSLGNGIDPLEVIDKYGADALRFFLATGNTPGNDMRYSDKRVEACANFANKLWNASRYVHMNIDDHDVKNELPKTLTTEDKWIVSTLNTVAKEVNENLEKFELGIAVPDEFINLLNCNAEFRRFMNSSGTATATGTLSLLKQDFQVTVRTLRMQDRYFFMCLIKFSDFSIRLCRTSQKKSGRQFLTRAKQ